MKKKNMFWFTLLGIGILSFFIPLCNAIRAIFNGFAFLGPAEYGLDAFLGYLAVYSYLFWPTYLIGIAAITVAIIFLRKKADA